jgi:hypothetical protein
MDLIWETLPRDILHIILKFNGTIIYFNGKYFDINKIKKLDYRYNLLKPVILKKINMDIYVPPYENDKFYFEFRFDEMPKAGFSYDLSFNEKNIFEICYFDLRADRTDNSPMWLQIRTYI